MAEIEKDTLLASVQHLRQEFSVGIENSVRPSVKTVSQYITPFAFG